MPQRQRPTRWSPRAAGDKPALLVRPPGRVRAAEPLDAVPFVAARFDDVAGRIDAERVSALVAELPAKQRDVIYLHHFAECSFAAIGDITGVSTFTAASRYRLGIGKLRRRLEERS